MVHGWLFVKGLYNEEAFVSRSLFGLNVKAVREVGLKKYISDFFNSIEELYYKGVVQSISLLLVDGTGIVENFMVKVLWIMNVYGLADNDKVVSSVDLELFYSGILANLYLEDKQCNIDNTFRIVVETVKEEACDAEEVLNNDKWTLVSRNTEKCDESQTAEGVLKIDWGYVKLIK